MREIKEKKMVTEEQTVYKYISNDGKFMSESRWEVEEYEENLGRPYFNEYREILSELKDYVEENKQFLKQFRNAEGTLQEMVLYLLLRDNNAKDCYVDIYSSGGDSWKVGDF